MYCDRCGSSLKPTSHFCSSCGKAVSPAPSPYPTTPRPVQSEDRVRRHINPPRHSVAREWRSTVDAGLMVLWRQPLFRATNVWAGETMGFTLLARPSLGLHSFYPWAVRNRPPCLGLGTLRTSTVGTDFRSGPWHSGTAKDTVRHGSRSLHALGAGPGKVSPRVRTAIAVGLFPPGVRW